VRRLVGLDLGQARDPTALVVLEANPLPTANKTPVGPAERIAIRPRIPTATQNAEQWQVRHLERFPLNRPYPEYVERTVSLMRTPELRRAVLVIDYTGVGRPVFDMFNAVPGLNPVGVLITGGTSVTHRGRIWNVPKRDLATAVLTLLQSRRLRVSAHIPESPVLIQELLNFRVKITLSGHDQYEAWREGDHDDLVLAAACASWVGLNVPAHQLSPRVGGQHRILVAHAQDPALDPRTSHLSEAAALFRDVPVTGGPRSPVDLPPDRRIQ
jgi:hypothetical protein